jgi:type IV pilus assembly protein PilA
MKARAARSQSGFTLIELMIVVAIVGILAVLAVYGVRKYLANAKTAEAQNSIGQIAKDAATQYEKESLTASILSTGTSTAMSRKLCKSSSTSVPAALTSVAGRKYQSATAEWNVDAAGNSGFACIKFSMDAPQYFMYSYAAGGTGSVGDTFTATANGDLNGDGNSSIFQVTGTVNSNYALNIAPNMLIVRPEE